MTKRSARPTTVRADCSGGTAKRMRCPPVLSSRTMGWPGLTMEPSST